MRFIAAPNLSSEEALIHAILKILLKSHGLEVISSAAVVIRSYSAISLEQTANLNKSTLSMQVGAGVSDDVSKNLSAQSINSLEASNLKKL